MELSLVLSMGKWPTEELERVGFDLQGPFGLVIQFLFLLLFSFLSFLEVGGVFFILFSGRFPQSNFTTLLLGFSFLLYIFFFFF